ncbi:SufD family Fe-S cluster assembly protein [Anaerotruncus sp. 80]|uniref:SufD family Fe-S cluster assembly protein n=1 Tax=Anaerotruncus colihominis TaxID=169435 RepID=A0A845QQA3_9FIRM|nr:MULTISPECIES: SufD family Fe-S cluster assembly protein [Clostridia]NBH62897.1 SufD family Fe-S cluster assembly protein [Anaerotruncus colihominis]NCE99595.1 SufD family Fe-S cluster assembly protein [Emergencia sp. 1XD21-10]NCF03551.1 SufD family Fe-S cluster assembly protein [Anaerotruncus sp. 80]
MDKLTEELLKAVSDYTEGGYTGAFNIRENGGCAGRQSTDNIQIEGKADGSGIDIYIKAGTKGEKVFIPACVTRGNVSDLVYNDFHVGEGADVVIVAGCGVHTDDEGEAAHNGIHSFYLERGAKVLYEEKHLGTGEGTGQKKISPVTHVELAEDAVLEMNTIQLGGVDHSVRTTTGSLEDRAKLLIHESLMTDGDEYVMTDFDVDMNGEDSAIDLISRSVAKGNSYQEYHSKIKGNNRCTGHSECDAILVGKGRVNAAPELYAGHLDAELIHEAAIGKVAGEQILKLRTLGLTEEEAEQQIIEGFLRANG